MRHFIVYAWFICGCFSIQKIYGQSQVKSDTESKFDENSEDYLVNKQTDSAHSENVLPGLRRMKSDVNPFSRNYIQTKQLKTAISQSKALLTELSKKILRGEKQINKLYENDLITRTEYLDKIERIELARNYCETLEEEVVKAEDSLRD